jgi:hypothetical protein
MTWMRFSALTGPLPGRTTAPAKKASGSVNRWFRFLARAIRPRRPPHPGFMIADAVRYMSVHS